MPKGWEPPVPAFTSPLDQSSQIVALYVGIQNPSSQSLEALNGIVDTLVPDCHDLAMFTDRAGVKNYVLIAYFASSQEQVQWEDTSGFAAWWELPEHEQAEYGLWMERYSFESGQFETLFSTPDSKEGLGRRFGDLVGPIREHGYPGGVEDRIPNARQSALQSPLEQMPQPKTTKTKGRRITVEGPANLCVIRSGQDLTGVLGDELKMYKSEIEPALAEGLSFLGENPETGCFESRYMTHCDTNGKPIAKTFGMQVFLSVGHLIEWAKSHPTHLKIFGRFQAMATKQQGQIELRLWHEVAVMGEGCSYAEYVNCHPQTGFLPFAHSF